MRWKQSILLSASRSQLYFLLAVFLLVGPTKTSHPQHDSRKRVQPGESIQKAIDDARSGEPIEIYGGPYHEQITINKDGIHLIGKNNATLLPPSSFRPNPCSRLSQTFDNKSAEAGICIHGQNVVLDEYISEHRKVKLIGSYTHDVSITGLTISGFTGENVAILGGQNTRISHNTLINGGQYGLLSVGSKSTHVSHNTVKSPNLDFIGLSIADISGSVLKDNTVTGYFTALVSETPGGIITHNIGTNVCVGAAADPGVSGTFITNNFFSTRNPACDVVYKQFGAGVVVYGATNTQVTGNTIEKFNNAGVGVGIFILPGPNGEVARDNNVKGNLLRFNDVDVFDNSNATNLLSGNRCESFPGSGLFTSMPASACV